MEDADGLCCDVVHIIASHAENLLRRDVVRGIANKGKMLLRVFQDDQEGPATSVGTAKIGAVDVQVICDSLESRMPHIGVLQTETESMPLVPMLNKGCQS